MLFAVVTAGFSQVNSVALVGEAAGGWPGDPGNPGPTDLHQMTSTDGENWTLTAVILTNAASGGGVKFRANNDWAINWGAAAFPTGTGTQNGANIPCIGGTYDVSFNSTTGVYSFSGGTPIPQVKLVGTAVSDPAGLNMGTTDAENYNLSNTILLDGTAQFDIDGTVFGGTTFPAGTVVDATAFIPVVAGEYSSITVNISSGDYTFTAAPIYPLISITGIAVGGWGDGFDFDMTTEDGIIYRYNALTIDGTPGTNELKFRTNHNWVDPNYGGTGWPSGIATTGPDNITCTASGTYDVVFNLTTGEFTFSFPLISLTGQAFGGWGDGFDFDLTTTDGANYSIASITATETNGAKFRSNHSWTAPNLNYGSTSFPTGIALATTGDNIPVVAGTYGVTFNRVTGEFNFGDPLATSTFNSKNFKVYPNPTSNVWNFASVKQNIESIQIVDMLGKTVMTISPKEMSATVDASSLSRGLYFAKIATANATETAKLMKN